MEFVSKIKNSVQSFITSLSHKQGLMLYRILASALLFVFGLLLGKIKILAFIVFSVSYLLCAYDVFIDAGKRIARGNIFDENILMTVASVGAFALGEFSEGCAVMILYQIGELFQSVAVNRSRKSIKAMMELRPDTVHKLSDGEVVDVDITEVKVGDILLIRPGERVPTDGVIVEGTLEADTSAITGESIPVIYNTGDNVISGIVDLSSLVKIKATASDAESTVSRILKIVEEQSENKSENEKMITRFARYYTPLIFALTLVIAVIVPLFAGDFRTWIYRGLSLLVISCPCAFVISIPLTYFAGIGGASKSGILVKGGSIFDVLALADTVALDKTGTLTDGALSISDVVPRGEANKDLLKLVAAISESQSNHPIAKSIIAYTGMPEKTVEKYREIPGKGTVAMSGGHIFSAGSREFLTEVGIEIEDSEESTVKRVFFAFDKIYVGYIEMSDKIKESAYDAIDALRELGIEKIAMFSGDKYDVAEGVCDELMLDICKAELKPEDKLSALQELMNDGKIVAFAGDGVNDAPTLSAADVGIAMGDIASDAALEAADVVIMDGKLEKLADAVKVSRFTSKIVKQNIFLTIGIKLAVLILTVFGISSMAVAIFADVGVAVIAILNAMRALKPIR